VCRHPLRRGSDRRGPGRYSVHCNVDGAYVYFDGDYKGTISSGVLNVPVCSTGTPYQTITVEMDGYQTYTGSLPGAPAKGEAVDVYVTLNPVATYGLIYATSSPSGAAVYLNGNYRGTTPLTIENVRPGSYTIEADLPGYEPYSTTVTVTAGRQATVSLPLSPIPQPGAVTITSNPSGAFVYMDGGV